MFTYAKIALLLLQVVQMLVNLARSKQLMDVGADREIAKASASILLKTQAMKSVMAEVTAMSSDQVDQALKGLEPK